MTARSAWIPWAFVGGMGIVTAVNAVMIVLAVSTFRGLAVDHPFEKGRTYERQLAQLEAQDRQGWSVVPSFRADGTGGELAVAYRSRDGRPVPDLAVTVELTRPVERRAPQVVALAYRGDGIYAAHLDLPLRGRWEGRVSAEGSAGRHALATRIWVP